MGLAPCIPYFLGSLLTPYWRQWLLQLIIDTKSCNLPILYSLVCFSWRFCRLSISSSLSPALSGGRRQAPRHYSSITCPFFCRASRLALPSASFASETRLCRFQVTAPPPTPKTAAYTSVSLSSSDIISTQR